MNATAERPLVEIRALVKEFGDGDTRVRAVDGVDLRLGRGEIVLVMGPSGSGKTTLLSMLGGLLRPTRGEIRIDGVDIAALRESELPPVRARTFGLRTSIPTTAPRRCGCSARWRRSMGPRS